jgi:hypothetical protein
VWAANAPFVGEWKLSPSKSKLTDQMKVESVAGNKYAFNFGSGSAETIVPDGTDQPGLAGTTLSITIEGPDWRIPATSELGTFPTQGFVRKILVEALRAHIVGSLLAFSFREIPSSRHRCGSRRVRGSWSRAGAPWTRSCE